MGLKLIVVLASGRERDERAINFGAQMAVEHDAKVEILPVYSDSAADMIAMGAAVGATLSQTVIDELLAAEGEVQRRIETVARLVPPRGAPLLASATAAPGSRSSRGNFNQPWPWRDGRHWPIWWCSLMINPGTAPCVAIWGRCC